MLCFGASASCGGNKLKKIDKDEAKVTKQITASPSKMQDILAIVSTACEVIVLSYDNVT